MDKNLCIVCGNSNNKWKFKKIISDNLANSWQLTKELRLKFDLRESQFCPNCGNSSRTRLLAHAIIQTMPFGKINLFKEWAAKANRESIIIAEINACGKLHPILAKYKNVLYSEYKSSRFLARVINNLKMIPNEDITNLSYPDKTFDLVIHSEVLEHVYNISKAFEECRRILKPNGICLFTIPIINNRKTVQCTDINKKTGEIINIKLPTFHGLDNRKDYMVWWEFGYDIIKKYNLEIKIYDRETNTYVLAIRKNCN